jgi:hypothetical protein
MATLMSSLRAPGAFVRARWPWRAAAVLLALAAGTLLALALAHWGWRWFGPVDAPPANDNIPETWAPGIAASAPFGRAPVAPPTSAPASGPSSLPSDTKLLGVFASRNGEGYALLRLPDRGAILVQRGQNIVGDVKLEAVNPNGIRIDDRGEKRELLLRRTDAPLLSPARSTPAPRPVASSAPGKSAACARPPGFTGPIFKLNAELLAGMGAKPDSWSALLAPANGALVVRDQTGLATMLGMKAGDRITQANGIALVAIDDVLTAVVRPLVASQPVRLAGTRDGKPQEWLFLNAGACPV